jgi:hypothetical protein
MRSVYVPLRNFGTSLSPSLRTDPVGYSLYKDIDSYFDIGPLARTFGTDSLSGQLYMAEKCSKQWDGACEFLSRNTDTTKVNVAKVDSPVFSTNEIGTMSIGDYLIENSATRRFCNFDTCSIENELYNVNDPTSPLVKRIVSDYNRPCIPVCKVPTNPDQDILLNKVLLEPHKHLDLLLNMYYNCKDNKDSYKNTKIANIFKLFDIYFQKKKNKITI